MLSTSFGIPSDPVVEVHTTDKRGLTPEELTGRCIKRLIHVADTAPQAIRDQAKAFEKDMEKVVLYYMKQAIRSDRTTIHNALMESGHPELAEAIRRL